MNERERRLAENESILRSVNERIEEVASSADGDEHLFEFVCECSNFNCARLLPMTAAEYESIRKTPTLFITATGLELAEIETVVLRREAYQAVVKRGAAALDDPRSKE